VNPQSQKDRMMTTNERAVHDLAVERRASEMAMRWYGWGSPVGLGLFLVALGVTALLVSRAISG
jgi:hypothetical protein